MALWRSPAGKQNAKAIGEQYGAGLQAMAEVDALGHRTLSRAADTPPVEGVDRIVGIALLRRAVTAFVGIRELLEASSVQPALVLLRSQFEIFLSLQYLVHGGLRRPSLNTHSSPPMRERRARYFMTASIRTEVYRMQAVLDGNDGADPPRNKEARTAIEAELEAEINRLEQHFATQHRRFGSLRCYPRGSKKPKYFDGDQWYSFGFPSGRIRSIKALAARYGYASEYFLIYSPLSDLGHARGVHHDVTISGGKVEIHSPHNPEAFAFITYWATSWQLLSLVLAAKAYCPNSIPDLQETQAKVGPLLDVMEEEAAGTVLG